MMNMLPASNRSTRPRDRTCTCPCVTSFTNSQPPCHDGNSSPTGDRVCVARSASETPTSPRRQLLTVESIDCRGSNAHRNPWLFNMMCDHRSPALRPVSNVISCVSKCMKTSHQSKRTGMRRTLARAS
ncbi:hypothetical protein PCAR4_540054 [Paraburkholderia caribensis]|nr:hypothetical protein PCAR4_540054 [Paraburkholderia caribensis]